MSDSRVFDAMADAVEILTAPGLAQPLKVKVSWIIDATEPARNTDPSR